MNNALVCRKCGYDLRASSGRTCPECGCDVAGSLVAVLDRQVPLDAKTVKQMRASLLIVSVTLGSLLAGFVFKLLFLWVGYAQLLPAIHEIHLLAGSLMGVAAAYLIGRFHVFLIALMLLGLLVLRNALKWSGAAPWNTAHLMGATTLVYAAGVGAYLASLGSLTARTRFYNPCIRAWKAFLSLAVLGCVGMITNLPTAEGSTGIMVLANVGITIYTTYLVMKTYAISRNAVPTSSDIPRGTTGS